MKLRTLHISSIGIWDIEKGKGRVSTYLPLKGFVSRGHDVLFLSGYKTVHTSVEDGISIKKIHIPFSQSRPLVRFLFTPLIDLCYFTCLLRTAKRYKPDVIYAHSTDTSAPARWVSKIFGCKFIVRLYGVGRGDKGSLTHFPSYFMRRRCLKLKADAFILTNDGTAADKVALRFGVPGSRIYFLKNGINKDLDIHRDAALKNKFAPDGQKLIISVCRLEQSKQVDLIIKMMAGVAKLLPSRLIVIGDGSQRAALEALAESLGIKESVVFLGALPQNKIYKYVCASDLFVSMNALSSMSNPVFEAAVCALPIIALDRGTTRDFIQNGYNGIVVKDEELDALPQKVCDLLSSEKECERLGRNAREYILKEWPNWEERVNNEVDIVESICIK